MPGWLDELSRLPSVSRFTGMAYPYPHMTSVEGEGIIGGGMEFPMLTLIGAYTQAGDTALYSVTAHELAHMWVPMIVGVDEKRYAWMDEGTTNFNENSVKPDFFPGIRNPHLVEQGQYRQAVRNGTDAELLRWSDYHYNGNQYGFASYTKPATLLWALRGVLGDEVFLRTYRGYLDAWRFKHPKPWDFFNAFERGAGRDLDWFWSTWYDETWTLDQAVAGVTVGANGATITIEDRGRAPMPVRLAITRAGGQTERREIPVEVWLAGVRSTTVTVPGGVTRVEIDPEQYFPDLDRANNVWSRN
jgi:aminopeptidase N